MTRKLDTRDTAVLTALRALGNGWHDRKQIADSLGRSQLSGEDLIALEFLTRDGIIETGKIAVRADGKQRDGLRTAYRLAEGGAQ